MTDRIGGVTLTLADDVRDDDLERLLELLRHLHGVIDVTPHVVDHHDHMARVRVHMEWRDEMYRLARDGPGAVPS